MSIVAISCDDALFDAGSETSREVMIQDDYSIIRFNNIFDVVLVQDTVNKIIYTCGEKLQDKIQNVVSKGKLILDHNEKSNWSRKYEHIKAEIHAKNCAYLEIVAPVNLTNIGTLRRKDFSIFDYSGMSEVNVNVDVTNCTVHIVYDSFGFFKVTGHCSYVDIMSKGSAIIRTDSLVTTSCKVQHRGFADLYVYASQKLDVQLEDAGNVYYTGSPAEIVIKEKLSSGNLINMNQTKK
jgi:hypothetical protein